MFMQYICVCACLWVCVHVVQSERHCWTPYVKRLWFVQESMAQQNKLGHLGLESHPPLSSIDQV